MFSTRRWRLSRSSATSGGISLLLGIVLSVLTLCMPGGCRWATSHVMKDQCSSLYQEDSVFWHAVDSIAHAELGSAWRSEYNMSCAQPDSLLIVYILPHLFLPDGSLRVGGGIGIGWNPSASKVQYVVRYK